MVITIYLTFDLTFNGDYTGMYKWLDSHHALECGDSACRINYSVKYDKLETYADTQAVLDLIRKDLLSCVKFASKDRVYVASLFPDEKNKKRLAGRFIVGVRKPNPWDGAAGMIEVDPKID